MASTVLVSSACSCATELCSAYNGNSVGSHNSRLIRTNVPAMLLALEQELYVLLYRLATNGRVADFGPKILSRRTDSSV
jgi:hypothetical protein